MAFSPRLSGNRRRASFQQYSILRHALSSTCRPSQVKHCPFVQGRVMYDIFLYATSEGYLLEYDARASEAPPLLAYMKRHVLRSKVKIRSVSDELDVWSAWGSETDQNLETQRDWLWARSGAVEPVWTGSSNWPWGSQSHVIHDRRAVGMGRRLLVRKGDMRVSSHPRSFLPVKSISVYNSSGSSES